MNRKHAPPMADDPLILACQLLHHVELIEAELQGMMELYEAPSYRHDAREARLWLYGIATTMLWATLVQWFDGVARERAWVQAELDMLHRKIAELPEDVATFNRREIDPALRTADRGILAAGILLCLICERIRVEGVDAA